MNKFENIVSPDGDDAKKEASDIIQKNSEAGAEKFIGEREKTKREKAYISEISNLLSKYFQKIGLDDIETRIPEKRVHYYPEVVFQAMRGLSAEEGEAVYDPEKDAVYINDGVEDPDAGLVQISKFSTLIHESLHRLGHIKFRTAEGFDPVLYRAGYETENAKTGTIMFQGFNEGIVALMENQILRESSELLRRQFSFKESSIKKVNYAYLANQELVLIIANEISRHKSESIEEALKRIMRGHFTGEMMHLRDIEKIYGDRSLRILARFDNPNYPTDDKLILEYFQTADKGRREEIKEEVLD